MAENICSLWLCVPSTIVGVADWVAVASGPPLGSGRAQGLAVRYPIAKARGLDPYSVPGCPGAGLSEPPFRSYRPPDTGSVPIDPMLEQPLRNRFSLVARRVSLGLLLRAHTRRVGSGWLFTEGLFPPTRSSALTISQFQRLDPTRDRPGHQDSFIFFNVVGPPLLPGPHTMWEVLKPGASAAEENWWDRSRSATSG